MTIFFVLIASFAMAQRQSKAPSASTSIPVYFPNAQNPEYIFDDFGTIIGNGSANSAIYDLTGTMFSHSVRTYGFGNPLYTNIRIGLSSNPGYITTKTFKDLNIYSENINVSFKIRQVNNSFLKMKVLVGIADAAGDIKESTAAYVHSVDIQPFVLTGGATPFTQYTLTIPSTATENMSIQFKDNGTGNGSTLRTFDIDDLKISNESLTTYVNGGWTNGEPNQSKDATVLEPYGQSITARSLNIDAGANVVVPNGVYHRLYGPLRVKSGSLTYEHGAYLKQPETVNEGKVTFKRNSKPMYRIDLNTWSSPVEGQNLKAFSPKTVDNRFYGYDGWTNDWYNLSPDDDFQAGIGVGIRSPNNFPTWDPKKVVPSKVFNGVFTGVPYSSTIQNEAVGTEVSPAGFNLIGNPFGAPIDLNKIFSGNLTEDKTTKILSIHFWSHTIPDVSQWGDNWQQINQTGSSTPFSNNFVDVGTGFFVKVQTSTFAVTLDPEMTTVNPTSTPIYHKGPKKEENSRIWLSLNDKTFKLNSIMVGYVEGASNDFDAHYDSNKQANNASGLYTSLGEKQLTIQGRALPFTNKDRVAMHLSVKANDGLFVQLEDVEGVFEEDQIVYLKDNDLKIVHNLSENPIYHFTSNPGEYPNRFELVYSKETLGLQEQTQTKDFEVYTDREVLNVVAKTKDLIKNIKLYDIMGKLVVAKEAINSSTFSTRLTKNVYILKVETSEGNVFTKKIIIQ